jgi:hypothetical protein
MESVRLYLRFWWVPYSASTWRRFAYALIAPPLAIVSIILVLAGHMPRAAEYQRRLAQALIVPATHQRTAARAHRTAIVAALVALAVGVACWLLLWPFTFTILPLPLAAACVALALTGRVPTLTRRPRPMTGTRVLVRALISLAVGLVGWLLLAYLPVFALGNLAFPFLTIVGRPPAYGGPPPPWDLLFHLRISYDSGVWASTYHDSNGGPTLAGAWTYHAGQFVVAYFPLFAWAIRGLTWLHGALALAVARAIQRAP